MLVRLSNVGYSIEGSWLLDDISLAINSTDKLGIVGRNGCGKSTLLKILSGELEPSAGKREFNKKVGILTVKQEMPDDDVSALEWLKNVDLYLKELRDQVDAASDDAFGDILEHIAQIEAERYEKLAPIVLTGLGLKQEDWGKPMRQLSGGFRMRISLASALIQQPSTAAPQPYMLLLDEPSNQLDLESIIWLTTFLKSYKNPYVIVSHDITLLNKLVTSIAHIQSGRLTRYKGDYGVFERQYHLQREQVEKKNEKIDLQQKHNQEFIDEWGEHQSTASLAQSRVKANARLEKERVEIVPEEPDVKIDFPDAAFIHNPLIKIQDGSVGYEKKTILSLLNLSVMTNSRIGILGRNGQGKSTLVRLLVGNLESKEGNIFRAGSLRIGYCSQDQAESLDLSLTPYTQLKLICSNEEDQFLRAHLGHFGFGHKKVSCKIADLSGGEKARLAFALISARKPHLIILDEPTNHLDIKAREKLIATINKFSGAIIMVSHDWQLMSDTMKQFLVVNNGKVLEYKGTIESYKKELLKKMEKVNKGDIKEVQLTLASGIERKPTSELKETKAEVKSGAAGEQKRKETTKPIDKMGLFSFTSTAKTLFGVAGDHEFKFDAKVDNDDKPERFSLLKLKRENVVCVLTKSLAEDEKNYAYLGDEIKSLALKDKLNILEDKTLNACLQSYREANSALQQLLSSYNRIHSKKFNADQMTDFLLRDNKGQHETLTQHKLKIAAALADLTSLCQNKALVMGYLEKGLGGTLQLGYRSTLLFAKLKGKADLYFWKNNPSNNGQLEFCDSYTLKEPKASYHFILSTDECSYHALTVNGQQIKVGLKKTS